MGHKLIKYSERLIPCSRSPPCHWGIEKFYFCGNARSTRFPCNNELWSYTLTAHGLYWTDPVSDRDSHEIKMNSEFKPRIICIFRAASVCTCDGMTISTKIVGPTGGMGTGEFIPDVGGWWHPVMSYAMSNDENRLESSLDKSVERHSRDSFQLNEPSWVNLPLISLEKWLLLRHCLMLPYGAFVFGELWDPVRLRLCTVHHNRQVNDNVSPMPKQKKTISVHFSANFFGSKIRKFSIFVSGSATDGAS